MLQFAGLLLFLAQLFFAIPTYAAPSPRYETTREYDFNLTWEEYSPDGFSKPMLLVNRQSPGPVIEATQGDWVVVRVKNMSPFNATVHFHGIEMGDTPWSDGVPGLSQRPIYPGGSFLYKFKASQHGSYWYHSHYRAQIEDGLYGAILIHPRQGDPKPFHLISNDSKAIAAMENAEQDVKPLIISDVLHLTSEEKWNMTVESGIEDDCYDSIIFNGKGEASCLSREEIDANIRPEQKKYMDFVPGSKLTDKACFPPSVLNAVGGGGADESKILPGTYSGCKKTSGKTEMIWTGQPGQDQDDWLALDIIGAMNFITGVVSIDEHDMWVYAMDGSYIEPQKVQSLVLTNGARFSVLIRKHKVGDFLIRCSAITTPQIIAGHAILHVGNLPYNGSSSADSKPFITIGGAPVSEDVVAFNQSIAAPFPPQAIAPKADALYKLSMRLDGASYLWAMNSSLLTPSMLDDNPDPVLFRPPVNKHDNTTISTLNNTWVDLVFYASTSPMPAHPIHKHGNKMFQIGAGDGDFNWSSVEEAAKERPELFNLVNPPRRDSFTTLVAIKNVSWIVVRYQVVNPGAWLLHCHISNHLSGGMSVVIQDGIDAWPTVPDEYLHHGV